MRQILQDHIAVVTGGGGEIGAAVVTRLTAAGARVIVKRFALSTVQRR